MKQVFLSCFLFLLFSCGPPVQIRDTKGETMKLSAGDDDSISLVLIGPYRARLEKDMNEVLGTADTSFEKGQPESLLGNFVADLVLYRCGALLQAKTGLTADICLLNNGGLRTSIPKGIITRGKIFELMPFENEVVALTISGKKMHELLQYVASSGGVPLSGMQLGIKNKAPGSAVVAGKNFSEERNYIILTSDYLAAGGDKMAFFSDPLRIDTLHYKVRDVIIDHIGALSRDGKKVNAKLDGRVHYE